MFRIQSSASIAFISLVATGFAFAQTPPSGPPPNAPPPIVTTAKFPGNVTMQGDIVFATQRGYRPLTLDLYLPDSGGASLPLVIFVHGGAWAGGSARSAEIIGDNFPEMWARLAAKGYAVASINYRLSSEAKFPAQVQDLNAAIRFLRAKASTYRIDANRVVVWGASAGAHITMLSALDCKQGKLEAAPANAPSTCVTAVIDWFGPTVLDPAKPSPTALAYLGCAGDACPDAWQRANVMSALSADAPPFLAVHGDADTTVPFAHSKELVDALGKLSVKAELKVVPNGNHLFRGAARPDIDAAIARSFAFIDEQLRPKR